MSINTVKTVPLYGGAMETQLPNSAIDVSQFRQIPDTQEVFILEKDTQAHDENIIIDLLEIVPKPYNDAISEHIEDVRDKVLSNNLVEKFEHPNLNCETYISFVVADGLITLLSLSRLKRTETDILLSMNIPIDSNVDAKTIANELVKGSTPTDSTPTDSDDIASDSSNTFINKLQQSYGIIKHSSLTLKINDWGLFGL